MNKTINKLLASMLVITLTFANLILLGTYATESLAAAVELENQPTRIKDKVDFDAYFLSEKGEKTHTKTMNIDAQEEKLYVSVNVLEGYLRNARITLEDVNFTIEDVSAGYELIESISDNTIILNQIGTGNENVFVIPIKAKKSETVHINDFVKENQIKMSGTVIGNKGRMTEVENVIKTELNLQGQANLSVTQQVTKFTPYNIGNNSGFMLQTTVKSGIENHTLPIEETNLSVAVPTLKDGNKPSKVTVTANSLAATRNDVEGASFTSDNWSYDVDNGVVSIHVKNEKNDQDMVAWGKEGEDEFVITYIFENKAMPSQMPIHLNTTLQVKAYNSETTSLEKTEEVDVTLEGKIGDIVTFEIENMQETLSKGYVYANNHYETEYQTKWIANLGYVDLIDQITMNQNADRMLNQNGEESGQANYTYYKSTQIAKDNFDKILGNDENAYIQIYDESNHSLIATITKDTVADEHGNLVVNYTTDSNNIMIQTSKPIKEGKLEIIHTRAIKANNDYTIEQAKEFATLKTDMIGRIANENTNIVETYQEKGIALTEPTTKLEAFVNNAKEVNLSTIVENKNVEFKVILQNTDNSADLYRNPVIDVVFPSYIEQLKVTNIALLFDEELVLDASTIQTYKTEDGRNAMRIPLTGTQTVYNFNNTQNGTNLVINADIKVNQLTPSVNDVIEAYVTNENATSYAQEKEGRAYQALGANFVAPTGMVTMNTMSNYNDKQEVATSLNGKEEVGEIKTQTSVKNGKVTATIINNYDATCKNVSILGRIPFEGNTSLASGESLGSTFTAKMISPVMAEAGIDASNITVYYSQNANATEDLSNAENGWTTEVSSMQDIKSYLIVCNNYEMQKGQSLVFSYNVEIPENLPHNESAFSMYEVIFDKVTEEQTIRDKMISPKVGISTGEGITLQAEMTNNVESNAPIQEGQIVKYTIKVTNTGKTDATNLKVTSPVPEGTIFVKYIPANTGENGEPEYGPARYEIKPEIETYETTIDSLKAGETKTVSYEVKVDALNGAPNKTASTYATIIPLDYPEDIYTTNRSENIIKKGYFNIDLQTDLSDDVKTLSENQDVLYKIVLTNVNNEIKNNIQLTMKIPEEITYKNTLIYDEEEGNYYEGDSIVQYDEQKSILTMNIEKLEKTFVVAVNTRTNKLLENETNKEISTKVEATCDECEDTILSNESYYKIVKPNVSIRQMSNIAEGTIGENSELIYTIEIENIGEGPANSIIFTDNLPQELICNKIEYRNGNDIQIDNSNMLNVNRFFSLEPNTKATIEITAKTKELSSKSAEQEITNVATISSDVIGTISSNPITHTIDPTATPSDDPNNPNGSNYRIAGSIWVDINEDGAKDDAEQKLEGIDVVLIDVNNNTVASQTTTNASGQYTFSDVEKGRYMVAFLYDSTLYTITDYQKAGVNDSRNSDAIEKSITVDNQVVIGAITDNIDITNSSAYNIDLGLVLRNKFDLSLTKSISHVTVKTTRGTQNYDYEDGTNLVKIDIAPKRIDGANVVIEYKFIVKNEGNIAGCANKIVDYLPSELKFSTNMNPDWYEGENGNVYNASLSNDMIQPGETREVTLTLTKTMTGESTGIVNNRAEIYEAYNDLGLEDINSTPGNKAQGENDMGSADVLLTVNTGEPVMYIAITIVMLALVALGAYVINKKVLMRKI